MYKSFKNYANVADRNNTGQQLVVGWNLASLEAGISIARWS